MLPIPEDSSLYEDQHCGKTREQNSSDFNGTLENGIIFSRVFPTFTTSYIRGFGASEGVSEGVGAILGLSWGHLWRFRDSEIRRFGDAGIQNSWTLVLSSFIEVGLE